MIAQGGTEVEAALAILNYGKQLEAVGELSEREVSERELSEREISEREISEREISEREISEREVDMSEFEPDGLSPLPDGVLTPHVTPANSPHAEGIEEEEKLDTSDDRGVIPPPAFEMPTFEMPTFEMPKLGPFEMPKLGPFEVPKLW